MLTAALLVMLAQPRTVGPGPCSDPTRETIRIGVGMQKVLNVPGWRGTSRSSDGFDVKSIGNDQLLLIGVSAGNHVFTLLGPSGLKEYSVEVREQGGCTLIISELPKRFPCGSTLTYRMIGDRVFLDGVASSLEEWRIALALAGEYPSVVILGKPAAGIIERELSEANLEIWRAGYLDVYLFRVGNEVFVGGRDSEGEGWAKAAATVVPRRNRVQALMPPPLRPIAEAR